MKNYIFTLKKKGFKEQMVLSFGHEPTNSQQLIANASNFLEIRSNHQRKVQSRIEYNLIIISSSNQTLAKKV